MKVLHDKNKFMFEGIVSSDKSITHRALMLLAISEGGGKIYSPLMSYDILSTMNALRKLGAEIQIEDEFIDVLPIIHAKDAEIDCGNSGTTIRLLMGLVSGMGVKVILDGDQSIRKRPMQRVSEYLECMGASITTTNGKAPIIIEKQLKNVDNVNVFLKLPSAQVKSAILLCGLTSKCNIDLQCKHKTRDHTERMIEYLGGDIVTRDNTIFLRQRKLVGRDITVCGDISSAAFVMAAAALGGYCKISNVGINETRNGIFKVFDMFGVNYSLLNKRTVCNEPVCDIEVHKSELSPISLDGDIIPNIIDEIPIISTMMAFCKGKSIVRGASELRIKESDRIKLIVQNMLAAGVAAEELDDGFIIDGTGSVVGGENEIITGGDHRIAMAFTILARNSTNGLYIDDLDCVNVSFSNFRKIFGV